MNTVKYIFENIELEYNYNNATIRSVINMFNEFKYSNVYCFGSFLNVMYGKTDNVQDVDLFYIGEYNKHLENDIFIRAKNSGIVIDLFYLPNYTESDIIGNPLKTIVNDNVKDLTVYRSYSVKLINNEVKYGSDILTEFGYRFNFKNELLYRHKDIDGNNLIGVKYNPIKLS